MNLMMKFNVLAFCLAAALTAFWVCQHHTAWAWDDDQGSTKWKDIVPGAKLIDRRKYSHPKAERLRTLPYERNTVLGHHLSLQSQSFPLYTARL